MIGTSLENSLNPVSGINRMILPLQCILGSMANTAVPLFDLFRFSKFGPDGCNFQCLIVNMCIRSMCVRMSLLAI